jgi:hypothetical protein
MARLLCLICLMAQIHSTARAQDVQAAIQTTERELLGTWNRVCPPGAPAELRGQKFVTPGHFIWATFDSQNRRLLAVAGGTWLLDGDKYCDSCNYASRTHQHLRGNTYKFEFKVSPEKWQLKGVPGTDIDVDEVWNRLNSQTRSNPKRKLAPGP